MEFTKDIQFNNSPTAEQAVTILYHGFLSHSDKLSIVYGFGQSWEYTNEKEMQKTENGFTVKIDILNFDTFNFCFRNANYEWDNNYNCNYISPISPCPSEKAQVLVEALFTPETSENSTPTFDINSLLQEILQPITVKPIETPVQVKNAQIHNEPVDLGAEITKALSEIENESTQLVEYSTLEEILSGSAIEQTSVELFEENFEVDTLVNEILEDIAIPEHNINMASSIEENTSGLEDDLSLIPRKDSFIISSRQLSKFYLFRKRIKLAFYKALCKIPKMIFGLDEQ